MTINVGSNPTELRTGEYIVFLTGEKSVNTYPKYMRIGKVLHGYNAPGEPGSLTVEELSTGKIWKPYTGDVIRVGEGAMVYGVTAKIELTERP